MPARTIDTRRYPLPWPLVLLLSSLHAITRRFLPPWTYDHNDACFIVKDRNGFALAYVYYEEEPGRPMARRASSRPASTETTLTH
jgi:hypothetical protein